MVRGMIVRGMGTEIQRTIYDEWLRAETSVLSEGRLAVGAAILLSVKSHRTKRLIWEETVVEWAEE